MGPRCTLLGDGPTDAALLPILDFLLRENGVLLSISPVFADLRTLPNPPKILEKRIIAAVTLYNPNLLLITGTQKEKSGQFAKTRLITLCPTQKKRYMACSKPQATSKDDGLQNSPPAIRLGVSRNSPTIFHLCAVFRLLMLWKPKSKP